MIEVVCLGQYTADVVVDPVTSLPDKGKAVFVESISLHNGGSACNAAVCSCQASIGQSKNNSNYKDCSLTNEYATDFDNQKLSCI